MMNEKDEKKSLLMLISSMLIFGSIGIFRRYIPASSSFLACMRSVIGTVFILLFLKIRKRKLSFSMGRRNLILLIVTGAFLGINWMLLFEAYRYTTVGMATMCYYMEPIIVIMLSPAFFKEHLPFKKLICVIAAMAGMFCVAGAFDNELSRGSDDTIGILFGLAAAFFYALVVMLNKKLDDIDAYEKTLLQLASASVVLLPYVLLSGGMGGMECSAIIIFMILLVGVVHTGIAYLLYIGSMRGLKAQSIAIISYLDPVTALILSWVVLGEAMTLGGIFGAALVLGAAAASEMIRK